MRGVTSQSVFRVILIRLAWSITAMVAAICDIATAGCPAPSVRAL